MATLPSECRQRKVPYFAPRDGKGDEASTIQGFLQVLIPFISSLPCPCPLSDPLQAQSQVYVVADRQVLHDPVVEVVAYPT